MADGLFDSSTASFGHDLWSASFGLDRASLFALAERYSSQAHFALQIHLRYCDESPITLFERFGQYLMGVEVRRSDSDEAGVVRLNDKDRSLHGCLAVVPGSKPNVWLLATDLKASSQEFDRLVVPLLDRLSGRLLAGWMSTQELEETLVNFEQHAGVQLKPGRVASRGYDRSSIEFLRHGSMPLVLQELRQRSLHLQSLDFKLLDSSKRELLSGGLNKWYRIQYRSGASYAIQHYLLSALEDRISSHFARVSICPEETSETKVTFKFDENALMNRPRHEKLVAVLSALPRASVCAFHLNPYLHLSVTDYTDGSSLNLLSDVADMLYVMPGPRCSSGAISRILDAVYNDFAPGRVVADADELDEWTALVDAAR